MKRIAITFLKIRKTKTGKLGIHTPCLPVFCYDKYSKVNYPLPVFLTQRTQNASLPSHHWPGIRHRK